MSIEGPSPVFATGATQALSAPDFDVVFVHGLSGDRYTTWTAADGGFWPQWLADEFCNTNVYVAGYDSAAFAHILLGSGASIQDLATTLADGLISRPRQAPAIVLITHSLGGLVVKQMLRRCADSADQRFQGLAAKIGAVVFLGTPHQGAQLANACDAVLRPFKSKASQQLAYSNAELLDLNNFFANFAVREKVIVRPFYETEKTNGFHIVDRVTANPGVYGAEPIAVQANHITICKPGSANASVYMSVCELLRSFSAPPRAITPAHTADGKALTVAGPQSAPLSIVPELTESRTFLPPSAAPENVPPKGVSSEILDDYEYFTTVAADDRRALDQKLRDAGREYQIKDATRRKERFAMALRRHIAQPSAVTRYMQILGDIERALLQTFGTAERHRTFSGIRPHRRNAH